jgi:hypothetical protein
MKNYLYLALGITIALATCFGLHRLPTVPDEHGFFLFVGYLVILVLGLTAGAFIAFVGIYNLVNPCERDAWGENYLKAEIKDLTEENEALTAAIAKWKRHYETLAKSTSKLGKS